MQVKVPRLGFVTKTDIYSMNISHGLVHRITLNSDIPNKSSLYFSILTVALVFDKTGSATSFMTFNVHVSVIIVDGTATENISVIFICLIYMSVIYINSNKDNDSVKFIRFVIQIQSMNSIFCRFTVLFTSLFLVISFSMTGVETVVVAQTWIGSTPGYENNTYGTNDSSAGVQGEMLAFSRSPWTTSGSWGIYDKNGNNMNDSYMNINEDYFFNFTIANLDGWNDTKKVILHLWYDGGNDTANKTYADQNASCPGTLWSNYHMNLTYINASVADGGIGEGTPVWKIYDTTNNSEVIFYPWTGINYGVLGCNDQVVPDSYVQAHNPDTYNSPYYDSGDVHNISFKIRFLYQIHHTPVNQFHGVPGRAISWSDFFNDSYSWNYATIMVDNSTVDLERPKGEFGVYKYTSLKVSDVTPYGSANPGNIANTTTFTINYSANYKNFLNITLDDNLTRDDWAKYLEWIGASNVTVNQTGQNLADAYSSGGVKENGELNRSFISTSNEAYYDGSATHPLGYYTVGHNHTFAPINTSADDDDSNSSASDQSYATVMEYGDAPTRYNNQTVTFKFCVYIPVGTLGGSYHTAIRFGVEHNMTV